MVVQTQIDRDLIVESHQVAEPDNSRLEQKRPAIRGPRPTLALLVGTLWTTELIDVHPILDIAIDSLMKADDQAKSKLRPKQKHTRPEYVVPTILSKSPLRTSPALAANPHPATVVQSSRSRTATNRALRYPARAVTSLIAAVNDHPWMARVSVERTLAR